MNAESLMCAVFYS